MSSVRMLVWAVGVVVLIGAALWVLQRRLTYFPGSSIPAVESTLPNAETVQLTTSDGLQLEGWLIEPQNGLPVVIVFNGNAGTRANRAPLAAGLSDAGFGVLLFDYRGYGVNPGSPSERGLAADARGAHRFISNRLPGVDIVYFGESLGAAVAIELATEHPPSALILRSPFTSIADVARTHYGLGPRWFLRDHYPSDERIGSVNTPVLVIAGSADSIVPADQSIRLHALAQAPKELLLVGGADHNDYVLLAGEEVMDAAVGFIREHTRD